jgi:hypothetical protein
MLGSAVPTFNAGAKSIRFTTENLLRTSDPAKEGLILAASTLAKGTEKLAKVVRLVELRCSGSIHTFPY